MQESIGKEKAYLKRNCGKEKGISLENENERDKAEVLNVNWKRKRIDQPVKADSQGNIDPL